MKSLIVVLVVLVVQTLAAPLTKESEERLRTYYAGLQRMEVPEAAKQLVKDIKSLNSNDKTTSDLFYDDNVNLDIYEKGLVPEEKRKELELTCYNLSSEYLELAEPTEQDLESDEGQEFLDTHSNEFPNALKNAYNVGVCARFLGYLQESGKLTIEVEQA